MNILCVSVYREKYIKRIFINNSYILLIVYYIVGTLMLQDI